MGKACRQLAAHAPKSLQRSLNYLGLVVYYGIFLNVMISMNLKILYCITVLLMAMTMAAEANPVSKQVYPRVEIVTFYSKVLQKAKAFSVVLPDNYDHAKCDWPVLFLFHGRGRTERSLIDDAGARESLLKAPFVIILPDGDDGWYIDSPVRTADKYNTYIEEVVAQAGVLYNLSQKRGQRALAGWSMGGYGAVFFAEKHSAEFSVVASIIGLLDFPRTGLPKAQSYEVPSGRFGDDPSCWAFFNPINHVESLRVSFVFVVIADAAFDRTMNENFTAALTRAGVYHEVKRVSGAHTFDVVCSALPSVISFVAKSFKPVSQSVDKGF